jgi:colanic acid/amylovoran biosynthesis protein
MKHKKVYLRAYFGDNLGDDIFVEMVAKRYPDADFLCLRSEKQLRRFPENVKGVCGLRERLIYRRLRLKGDREASEELDIVLEDKAVKKADLAVYVVGSGFMEDDRTIAMDKRDRIFFRSRPYVLGASFGPYENDSFLVKYKKYFDRCKDVCFRDSFSAKIFSGKARRESDIVFAYDGAEDVTMPEGFERYQVIAPASSIAEREKYVSFLKECISYAAREGIKTILAVFCKNQGDGKVADELACDNCLIFEYPDKKASFMAGLIKDAERVIAVRHHSAVLAMRYSVPVAVLAYSEKTTHMIEDIGGCVRSLGIDDITGITAEEFIKGYSFRLDEEKAAELKESALRQFEALDKELGRV